MIGYGMADRPHSFTMTMAVAAFVISLVSLGVSGFSAWVSYENRVSPLENIDVKIEKPTDLHEYENKSIVSGRRIRFSIANVSSNPITISLVEIKYGTFVDGTSQGREWRHWFEHFISSLKVGSVEEQLAVTIDPSKIVSEEIDMPRIEEENAHQAIEIHVKTSRDQDFFGALVVQ